MLHRTQLMSSKMMTNVLCGFVLSVILCKGESHMENISGVPKLCEMLLNSRSGCPSPVFVRRDLICFGPYNSLRSSSYWKHERINNNKKHVNISACRMWSRITFVSYQQQKCLKVQSNRQRWTVATEKLGTTSKMADVRKEPVLTVTTTTQLTSLTLTTTPLSKARARTTQAEVSEHTTTAASAINDSTAHTKKIATTVTTPRAKQNIEEEDIGTVRSTRLPQAVSTKPVMPNVKKERETVGPSRISSLQVTKAHPKVTKTKKIKAYKRVRYGTTVLYLSLHTVRKTWDDALKVCQNEEGSLVKLDSKQKQYAYNKLKIHRPGKDNIHRRIETSWIGLRDIHKNNAWYWADGSRARIYPKWCLTHTSVGHCVMTQRCIGIQWKRNSCRGRLPFVCERPQP